jgi:hypothetical protein
MAADLQTLEFRRDALKRALASGAHSVSVDTYHQTFRSVAEIQAAIKDVETDIADLQGTAIVRTYRFHSQKGI